MLAQKTCHTLFMEYSTFVVVTIESIMLCAITWLLENWFHELAGMATVHNIYTENIIGAVIMS